MDEVVAAVAQGPPILPPTPAGLESLYSLCRKIYPDQVNPLQVTALLKFWLGGPDPLDYISMYANPGVPHENIPPHWHYISFGLSDLHGDGRVHDVSCPEGISGFGFELTFRLKREAGETAPPTWPATLMQSLAKYVFQSGNTLCPGDHVSWHCALDNSESRIQHMLMTTDPQLRSTKTPFGNVEFVQIVGVCADEMRAAQQWNGAGILDMIGKITDGGQWHITDMRRGESIFELDASAHEEVEQGFESQGSNLSGVSARCSWSDQDFTKSKKLFETDNEPATDHHLQQKANFLIRSSNFDNKTPPPNESTELQFVKKFDGIHLIFNLEAGNLLPFAIRGRVKHGRHFTFKSIINDIAITLVAPSVTGTMVDSENPYVAKGPWLHVLIPDDLAQDMAVTFQVLTKPESLVLPKTFTWPEKKLSITIVADNV
ncbi:suppressor of fused homolog [Onthophagus taurus]|uniref:suppressor of fused homolog n=1 Tax=Onthophagus taurus TaxID=166361 RepID=UPI000C207459|nr:suppressor of fused homolog [Onthophagus taurus]XP_022908186.1 suppressor of fused homolog [Onthophagus taurus]